MTTLAADHVERLARRAEFGLTVTIVLGLVEILRRSPRWLLIAAGLAVYVLVMLALAYLVWIEVALVAVVAWKLGRGAVQGWREIR